MKIKSKKRKKQYLKRWQNIPEEYFFSQYFLTVFKGTDMLTEWYNEHLYTLHPNSPFAFSISASTFTLPVSVFVRVCVFFFFCQMM